MSASIALVDDDRNILTSVSMALQAEGFVVRIYSDGEAALKATRLQDFRQLAVEEADETDKVTGN